MKWFIALFNILQREMNNDTHTESEKSTKFSTNIYPYIIVDVVDIKLVVHAFQYQIFNNICKTWIVYQKASLAAC